MNGFINYCIIQFRGAQAPLPHPYVYTTAHVNCEYQEASESALLLLLFHLLNSVLDYK